MVHGGVGDFLFQLDLAKRLATAGIHTLILVRKNHLFLTDIVQASNVQNVELVRADGLRYVAGLVRVWFLACVSRIAIINSFHATHLRLPTRLLYAVAHALSAEVIVCGKEHNSTTPYTQFVYKEHELIWQRNNRIVTYLQQSPFTEPFPVVSFATGTAFSSGAYIHIHPVGSVLQKSYPPKKLIAVLEGLGTTVPILLTLTPREEAWYVTDELRTYIAAHPHITLVSKRFSVTEIAGYIAHASVFCTVNTGLLWLALMLKQRVVVCDTFTDFEWNPLPYGNVTRLSRDTDEEGKSLHLVLGEHEDGTYYESMYRIAPEEVASTISMAIATS